MPRHFSKLLKNNIYTITIKNIIIICFVLLGMINFLFIGTASADAALSYPGIQPKPLIDIRDLINVGGPDNTKSVTSIPKGPLLVKSSAVDAVAIDYVYDGTSFYTASIFAAVTVNKPYEHTYQVCNRAKGFTLDEAYTIGMPELTPGSNDSPQFWYLMMSKKGTIEKAFIFTIYVNEANKTFTVDSFWWPTNSLIAKSPAHNYIFNFQVVAVNQQDAYNLTQKILTGLSKYDGWQIRYINNQPIKPPFLIKDVDLTKMRVQNLLSQPLKVSFDGYIRRPDNKEKDIPFNFSSTLVPGLNIVQLPLTNSLDSMVYAWANDFLDEVYAGSGYWLVFSNKGKTITKTEVQEPANNATQYAEGDFPLGSAGMKGRIPENGWGGLAHTLNPNSLPVDISRYTNLSFWARGDGNSYSVQLETEAVRELNSHDFHQYVITTSPEWRQYNIPFTSFKQLGTDHRVPFTGTDVISVAWQTVGAPLDSVNLEIKDAVFKGSTVINLTIGSSKMRVNGAAKDIDAGYQTVPIIRNGRTYVPIRAIVESLGGKVGWDAADQALTINLNNIPIVLWIDQQKASINGVDKSIDDAPFIAPTGRTMVPLRVVAENLGCSIDWDGSSKTITIQ